MTIIYLVNSWNFQTEYNVNYYIALLTNGNFKKNYKEDRNIELYIFCLLMANGPPPISKGVSYTEVIKSLGYEKIFKSLREEAIKNAMKNFELIGNETCPTCLSSEVDNYKGLYKCCHHSCYQCYMDWKKRTCPICRAADNYINK